MLTSNITSISFGQFRELTAGKKVVLLYPWIDFRNVFLSYYLNDLAEGLLYYRVPARGESLAGWVGSMVEGIREIAPAFGPELGDALDEGSPKAIGAALAADLGTLRRERVVLYLDELDRVAHDARFRVFITTLVESLPAHVQLAVNSRLLTYEPWIDWVNRDDVVVLGTYHRGSNLMFTKQTSLKPQLEIVAFGRGHVISNGLEITRWDGALPRNLFFFFVDNPLTTRDQIFEKFWPQLSIRDATNVFHVTKRKITLRISVNVDDGKSYELTKYTTGFYVPSGKLVRHYDVADFEQAMEDALVSSDPREQELLFRRAIEIYRAPYLYPLDLPWIVARRRQLQMMYAEALIGMARVKAANAGWEEALGFYSRALQEVPQREDIHRGVMEMYIKLGRNGEALRQYTALEGLLKRRLGVKPSRETQDMLKLLD